ncbi:MAG: 4Fe-4S binding protein [Clostridiales bacterium]|nr:4Fe-4S binding protein [Clostridiales bacterium]
MAYRINSNCNNCGKCEFVCPEDAIREGRKRFEIDPDVCDSCGGCDYVCPEDAIIPD